MEVLNEFNFISVCVRLLLAMACGAIIGRDRSERNSPAGLRTYMMVCTGAALTILISMYEYEMLNGAWKSVVDVVGLKFDASRFAASVIGGIGFLAAGSVVGIAHQQVIGLTTATGLFATAIMGIACGAGFYEAVIIATIMILICLEGMGSWEARMKRRLRNMTLFIEFTSIYDIERLQEYFAEHHIKIFDVDVENTESKDDKHPSAIFTIKLSKNHTSHSDMLSTVAELSYIYSVYELVS